MDFHKLIVLLSSPESKHNLKALKDIRTRVVKTKSGVDGLLEENFVEYFVSQTGTGATWWGRELWRVW